jgi:3-methyl-2-oxobutanoate hydroxymethyltransferase
MEAKKITTAKLTEMKKKKKKITVLTSYDFPTAKMLDEVGVDIVLVGDSLGNVVLGYKNTLPVTMEDMLHHAKAVARGVKNVMLIVDMPFMSFQITPEEALYNASRFAKEAGAEGVKIEGDVHIDAIKMIVRSGIPVMGHLGFTPQLVNKIGGYRVQGKSKPEGDLILKAAKDLERAGVFSIVLEMVPGSLAKKITRSLKIPTLGIGAGPHCDGQVLVTHDMVGLYNGKVPKYVKQYANLGKAFKEAVATYICVVETGKFPGKENSF